MKRDWERVTLGSVVEIASGQVDPRQVPYCDMIHVGGDNIESHSGKLLNLKTAGEQGLISGKYLFDRKDVLYSKIRPVLNKVVAPDFEGICSADIYPLRPINGKLCKEFLVHLLRSDDFLGYTATCSSRTNIPKINRDALFAYQVMLPPLPEQRRIAAILDKADAIRRNRQGCETLAQSLARSLFREMFGDIDSITCRWSTRRLGELLSFMTSGSRGWAAHYTDSGDRFLRIQNVGNDELLLDDIAFVRPPDTTEARRTSVQPGDVLLSVTADLGRSAAVPEGIGTAYINQHLCILRAPSIEPRFLSAFFTSPSGRRQVLGRNRQAVKAGLNFDDVRSFLIPVPPIELQREFANRAAQADHLRHSFGATLLELEELFDSLVQRAFRGEL